MSHQQEARHVFEILPLGKRTTACRNWRFVFIGRDIDIFEKTLKFSAIRPLIITEKIIKLTRHHFRSSSINRQFVGMLILLQANEEYIAAEVLIKPACPSYQIL